MLSHDYNIMNTFTFTEGDDGDWPLAVKSRTMLPW